MFDNIDGGLEPQLYPRFFDALLFGKPNLRSALDSSVASVASLLKVSHLPFFGDYTDHGLRHLAKVCEIADKLLADSAREVFSAEDTVIFVLSVLLHDLGMHLSESGFASLVNLAHSSDRHSLDAKPWPDVWHEFLDIARHWDELTLIRVFGADETGTPRASVRDPFEHYDNLTEDDRKLIGEFIRQNHIRMAHEFAVFGFPGPDGTRIQFGLLSPEMMDLAGVIARSHGMPLRSALIYLEQQFSKLEYENVHPLFLMALLRVADYLDLGEDRAPLIAFRYKEFKSPVSYGEFKVNQAFRKISWGNPDSESIQIPAKPSNILEFLELKNWLSAIQSELDTAWAVFGEIYGDHTRFSKFRLSIRRVRSNVDDVSAFANSSLFVPKRIELGVNVRVLKLFLQPLYGDSPEVGIRELVQNAVDAIRERWEFVKNHPALGNLPAREQDGDVVVSLEEPDELGTGTLTVSDNGIGMTEEVVCDYFLKAGASFRENIAWKREFESYFAGDAAGPTPLKSRVLRSGRFGIGILAAFLLGDELEVFTRHISAPRGFHFRVRFDSRYGEPSLGPIQLDYDGDIPPGTTIRVKVRPCKKKASLEGDIFSAPASWDWYCFTEPSVVRTLGKKRERLSQSTTVPSDKDELLNSWHKVPTSDYKAVYMRLPDEVSVWPLLVCNGIKIHGAEKSFVLGGTGPLWQRNIFPRDTFFHLYPPALSILDPDGRLPLNLQRSGLTTGQLSFSDDAFSIRAKTILAKLLHTAPQRREITPDFRSWLGHVFEFEHLFPVFFTNAGTALLTLRNLNLAGIRSCVVIDLENLSALGHVASSYDALIIVRSTRSLSLYGPRDLDLWTNSMRVIVREGVDASSCSFRRLRKDEASALPNVYAIGGCPNSPLGHRLTAIISESGTLDETKPALVLAELFFDKERLSTGKPRRSIAADWQFGDSIPDSPMGKYWEQLIGSPVIPYSHEARRSELQDAFKLLREFLPTQDH